MKGLKMVLSSLCILMTAAVPAFAVNTAKTYNSGLLVLAFVGVCGLVVLVQLMPSLLILFGWLKALGKPEEEQKASHARAK